MKTKTLLLTAILSLVMAFQGCEKEESFTSSNFKKSIKKKSTTNIQKSNPSWYENLTITDISDSPLASSLTNGTLSKTTQDSLPLVTGGIQFDQISNSPNVIKYSNSIGDVYLAVYPIQNSGTVVGSINKIVTQDESFMTTIFHLNNLNGSEAIYNSSLETVLTYDNTSGESDYPYNDEELADFWDCVYNHYDTMMDIIDNDPALRFWCDLSNCEGSVATASVIHCATAHIAGPSTID